MRLFKNEQANRIVIFAVRPASDVKKAERGASGLTPEMWDLINRYGSKGAFENLSPVKLKPLLGQWLPSTNSPDIFPTGVSKG